MSDSLISRTIRGSAAVAGSLPEPGACMKGPAIAEMVYERAVHTRAPPRARLNRAHGLSGTVLAVLVGFGTADSVEVLMACTCSAGPGQAAASGLARQSTS